MVGKTALGAPHSLTSVVSTVISFSAVCLAYGHYLTVLVAIDIRQVVNGTTIHVNEMARQLGGGGVSVTGQGRYGGSRFVRPCCGLKSTLLGYL